jgi:hypothetical protein
VGFHFHCEDGAATVTLSMRKKMKKKMKKKKRKKKKKKKKTTKTTTTKKTKKKLAFPAVITTHPTTRHSQYREKQWLLDSPP